MNEIKGFARLRMHPGKLQEFKDLQAQCMAVVRAKDTGTLQYEAFFNDTRQRASSMSVIATRTHCSSISPISAL